MAAVAWRDAGPGDAAALAAIGRDSFTETFGPLDAPEDLIMRLKLPG